MVMIVNMLYFQMFFFQLILVSYIFMQGVPLFVEDIYPKPWAAVIYVCSLPSANVNISNIISTLAILSAAFGRYRLVVNDLDRLGSTQFRLAISAAIPRM